MKTIRAVFEKGVFRPLGIVDLPEQTLVDIQPPPGVSNAQGSRAEILRILSQRFDSGETDIAARHDEHQP